MSIIAWVVLGLVAGFIGSRIVNKTGEGVVLDIVLGIVGALVGGFLLSLIRAPPTPFQVGIVLPTFAERPRRFGGPLAGSLFRPSSAA